MLRWDTGSKCFDSGTAGPVSRTAQREKTTGCNWKGDMENMRLCMTIQYFLNLCNRPIYKSNMIHAHISSSQIYLLVVQDGPLPATNGVINLYKMAL